MTASLFVTGGQDAEWGSLLQGVYQCEGENHGRHVFHKKGDVGAKGCNVVLYYWDNRDGPQFAGWWFSPFVGSDNYWGHCPGHHGAMPPKIGWLLFPCRRADPTLSISWVCESPSASSCVLLPPPPPPPPARYTHKGCRKDGRTRTKSKLVLKDDHPLVKKRKADNAKRAAMSL